MTDNKETIEMLKMLKEQALKSHNDTAVLEVKIDSFNFVLDEAIKALEQQSCEDAISRKDMLAIFRQSNSLSQAWNGFENLPSVTPKEKTGHWEYVPFDNNPNIGKFHCSECNRITYFEYNFCPNCGARMVIE